MYDINVGSGPRANLLSPAAVARFLSQKPRFGGRSRAACVSIEIAAPASATPMLSKVCAAWLVVLVTLPFTAPFSTLDLADLLSGATDEAGRIPGAPVPATATAGAALSHAVPLPPRPGRTRLAQTRLHALEVRAIADRAPRPASNAWLSRDCHATRPTVLRI